LEGRATMKEGRGRGCLIGSSSGLSLSDLWPLGLGQLYIYNSRSLSTQVYCVYPAWNLLCRVTGKQMRLGRGSRGRGVRGAGSGQG
jgi:hypothetical protein